MNPRSRSFWALTAALAYVCVDAARGAETRAPWLALFVLPLILAEAFRQSALLEERHGRHLARDTRRAAVFGVLLWVAARTGAPGREALDAAGNVGIGVAVVAALVALARIDPLGGCLRPPKAALSLDAATFVGFLWGIAAALPLGLALLPRQMVRLDPLAIDYATTSAGIGSLFVCVAACFRARALRGLELGVADRANGALALSCSSVVLAIVASFLDVAPPDRILPVAAGLAALGMTWAATTPEPTTVPHVLRGVLSILLLGTPVMLAMGVWIFAAPEQSGAIVLATAALSIAVGLLARAVARPLGPEQSRWLDAIDAASRGALQPEPDAALRAALFALGGAAAEPEMRPAIFRSNPSEVLSCDVAGYLHVTRAEAPARLYDLALEEPERTLRAEALTLLAVRRPDLRALGAWMDDRGGFAATVVVDEEGPIGFILLPKGRRRSAMTLEEARAMRLLADRISALLGVSSALARSRERELSAQTRAERVAAECQRLERIIEGGALRHREFAERLAQSVRTTGYSPAARQAFEGLERLARLQPQIALLAAKGIDVAGYAAHAHLSSPRADGPLLVLDATNPKQHDLARWQDPERSPLVLADGGTLTLLDAQVLPSAVQDFVARELGRAAPLLPESKVAPPGLILGLSAAVADLVESGRVARELGKCVMDGELRLPTLAERGEDLRALALDALGRIGLGERGEPLGIDAGALRLLLEHSWPGNELEFRAVLLRAAELRRSGVLRAEDLFESGFRTLSVQPEVTPPPASVSRRPVVRRLPRAR